MSIAVRAMIAMTTRTLRVSNREWIIPDWPAPPNVRSLVTTRIGGVSQGIYASLNLGDHVGDDPRFVAENRARLREWTVHIGDGAAACSPVWLNQVHGTRVVDAAALSADAKVPEADAAFSRKAGAACVVMTADCLPVLLCDDAGSVVAAAHAGWRGLLAGVLEATIAAMGPVDGKLLAYLGPAIGPQTFEVGDEVRSAFVAADAHAAAAFKASGQGKWLADIYALARQRLLAQGVEGIYGGSCCTVREADRFFSYRRDRQTGRMATMIWLL